MTLATPTTGVGHAFTVPDGSRIALYGHGLDGPGNDGPGNDGNDGRWNCLFVARIYGAGHAFTVCPAGTAELLVDALKMTDPQVEPYRGADLLLAYDATDFTPAEHGETLAAWRGRWHELHTARTGPRMAPSSFTRVFDAFTFTDTRDGLLVRPRSARNVKFEPFTVFRQIPGIGDLKIQRPHEAHVALPRWRGAIARGGGEIWRRPLTEASARGRARAEVLVLATATAVCELSPGPMDSPDGDVAAEFLAGLEVTWTPA